MNQCYKCGTDKELSKYATKRNGDLVYKCKPCRREAYHLYRSSFPESQRPSSNWDKEAWEKKAKEIYDRISQRARS